MQDQWPEKGKTRVTRLEGKLREREREGRRKGKSETESSPPACFSILEKNKSLRFSLRNEGGKKRWGGGKMKKEKEKDCSWLIQFKKENRYFLSFRNGAGLLESSRKIVASLFPVER